MLNHAIHSVNHCTVGMWYQNALNYPVESDLSSFERTMCSGIGIKSLEVALV